MPTDEELRKAIKAFRKRMKMNQLEEDSKLGHSPLTGARNKIVAIRPPTGFGAEVWQELVTRGLLKPDGGGFYQLTNKTDL